MKNYPFYFFCLLLLLQRTVTLGQQRLEFNGPLNGWADVKKQFGAHGNGKDDDTQAFQKALDGLSNPATGYNMGTRSAYVVIYVPAGAYTISSTLELKGKIGVSIIGEDPARTTIKWTGKDAGTMLLCNGSAYFKISRLTWDAGNRKNIEGIGVHWRKQWNDATGRSFAPLNIELSDNVFVGGMETGIGGGTDGSNGTNANDSEIAIRRCVFNSCTVGVSISGYNALDYWVWDCQFIKCQRGIYCNSGNYHVYRSFFSGNLINDFDNVNSYYTSVRHSYSENSGVCSKDEGMSCNPFKRIFQDNIIAKPRQANIGVASLGKITLWDNKFEPHGDQANKFSVYYGSFCPGNYEVLSINNQYGFKDPILIDSRNAPVKKIFSISDKPFSALSATSSSFASTMEKTPSLIIRKVFEVPAGANAAAIQSILNEAATLKGQRPVVHFSIGTYIIDRTLVIPAGADMQLQGEGLIYATILRPANNGYFSNHPLLLVNGPSSISITDLQIANEGDVRVFGGIQFVNVDQPSAQAHLDQVYSAADTSLIVDGLNYLYVEKNNSFFTAGNYISGGNLVQQGKGTACVRSYGGQFKGLVVRQNGDFLARDCWWEGKPRLPLDITGSGKITLDGAMIAPDGADSLPTIRINKFDGNISLLNMYVQGGLTVQPNNPGLNLLVWNIHFYHKMNPLEFVKKDASYKAAFLGLNAQCFRPADPACKDIVSIEDRLTNCKDANPFLESLTATDRSSKPQLYRNLSSATSNIYVSRVTFYSMGRGLIFRN